MATIQALVDDFLAQQRIAIVGVSRTGESVANLIYHKFRDNGYTVFAVNPNAITVEGDPCYPDVLSTPETPDAVMIVTTAQVTDQIVRDCANAGIKRVWMHCSFMHGVRSTSNTAVEYCKQHQIDVIPMGCPMMFLKPDVGHQFIKWWMRACGTLPA
jgi:uncharacterized protein